MVKITLLPAQEGDFIWVSYGDDEKCNHILIDGGVKNTGNIYSKVLKEIHCKRECVTAVIFTHIDIDHIQGAIEGINILPKDVLKKVIKKIYFNTCRGIRQELGLKICGENYGEDDIIVKKKQSGYGVGEAITLLKLLEEKELLDCIQDYVLAGDTISLNGGAVLRIISPGKEQLVELADKWEAYGQKKGTRGYSSNLEETEKDLSDLAKQKLLSDGAVNNKSSIAFLFEFDTVKLAFLADAVPAVCLRGLKQHQIQLPYPIDLFKLSHHGSRSNTSDRLLSGLPTQHYLLSTNGHEKKVPSKVVIAHLLKNF